LTCRPNALVDHLPRLLDAERSGRWIRIRGGMQVMNMGARLAGIALCTVACNVPLPLPFGLNINFPGFSGAPIAEAELNQRIRTPKGFSIATYASGIPNARMLRFTPAGDLLVSAPRDGRVYLLTRGKTPNAAGETMVLLGDLDRPHGLALHEGWLYVAESGTVLRVRFDPAARRVTGPPQAIIQGLPSGGNHWTRTIGIGPDEKLYVSIGSSCNVCIEKDPRRAAIVRYALDGSGEQLYATGLRNAVGFAWQPGNNALYATDNGRDLLGDDFPPCELNRVVEGGFFGWPFANGNRIPDPDYGEGRAEWIAASIPPVHEFAAHTAPLGITFYTGTAFPERYRAAAFVALHGSWNRSTKIGYEVVALLFQSNGTVTEEKFITGFEVDEKVIGRPVDVALGPDGALYVSDDFTGSVYRVAYGSDAPGAAFAPPAGATGATDPLATLTAAERSRAAAGGAMLWQTNQCATCHVAGQGNPNYRPLGQLGAKFTIESLAAFLRVPQPPMPAYGFSDTERHDLAVYLLLEYP
jgi:glucose/arabinose dehydrogenase